MYASGSIGYNHPKIVESQHILGRVSKSKPTLSDLYNSDYADFMKTFDEIAIPDYLKHTFFIEGGSLAVENALKIAFDWKVRKNLESGNSKQGSKIIHFKQAFHGRSGYTLSLTNTSDPRKTMYFPKFNWPRIDNPYLKFPITDESIRETVEKENIAIAQIKEAIKENPGEIAAIIIEPIQGEGGDNHFRCAFFQKLKDLSLENEFLLIYDEVQTGIGITGKMWAHQHFSQNSCKNFAQKLCQCESTVENSPVPDIISFGKKSQVCGVLAGPRIDEVENNSFVESSRINSTFGGSLTDMMRFKIILEVIRDEKLVDNARDSGNYLLKKLIDLSNEFPGFVTNPRGLGLFAAFDLPSGTERDHVWNEMMKNNLLILPSGDQSIRFRPHLNVTTNDLDTAIDLVSKSLKKSLR